MSEVNQFAQRLRYNVVVGTAANVDANSAVKIHMKLKKKFT